MLGWTLKSLVENRFNDVFLILGYFPREKPGSCPPAKYPEDYYDDYYTRNINPYRSGNLKINSGFNTVITVKSRVLTRLV